MDAAMHCHDGRSSWTGRAARSRRPYACGKRVADVMSTDFVACEEATPLRAIAEVMARARVHYFVIDGIGGERGRQWRIVAEPDVVAAVAAETPDLPVGAVVTEIIGVAPDETLRRAAQTMAQQSVTHLLVVDPGDGRPIGVVSALDVTKALCGAAGHPHEEQT